MSIKAVKAKLGREENAPELSVNYDFGDSLDESVETFGENVVHSRFVSAATVDLQALIRRHASGDEPKTEGEIQAIADEWKPGVAKKKKSGKEKALAIFDDMTDDERKDLIAQLTNQ